jgi:hypothetical protein
MIKLTAIAMVVLQLFIGYAFGQVATVDVTQCMNEPKQLDLSDFASKLTYIPLSDSNQTALLGQISKFAANNSYIVIYDNLTHKLFLYNRYGKFLKFLADQGKGPFEYIGINSIDINNRNEVLVLMNGDRIAIINAEKNTKHQFDIVGNSPVAKWLDDDKIVILYPFPYFVVNQGFEISFVDQGGKVIKNAMPNSVKGISFNDQVPRFNCARNGDVLYYWNTFKDTVFTITKDMRILPRLIFKHSRFRYSISELMAGAEVNGNFNSDLGYMQTSYWEFGGSSLSGLSYKRKRFSLLIDRASGIGGNVLYDYNEAHNRGFKNNLDGGVEFWPNFASFNGELLTYIDPNDFREAYLKNKKAATPVKSPSQQLSLQNDIINKITLMENPILIKLNK